MQDKEIDVKFKKAVVIANQMEAKPQDVMLEFYAYYKQATIGENSNFTFNTMSDMDVRSAFKFNAWMQVKDLTIEEAKLAYIELVEKHSNTKL